MDVSEGQSRRRGPGDLIRNDEYLNSDDSPLRRTSETRPRAVLSPSGATRALMLWLLPIGVTDMPRRSNEFQRLVAMLTALSSGGAAVHESVELLDITSSEKREVDVVAIGEVRPDTRPSLGRSRRRLGSTDCRGYR